MKKSKSFNGVKDVLVHQQQSKENSFPDILVVDPAGKEETSQDPLVSRAVPSVGKCAKTAMDFLREPLEQNTPSRHSAASLKVHFQSVDNVISDSCVYNCNHLRTCEDNQTLDAETRRRSQSETTTWSVSETELGLEVSDEDYPEEDEVNDEIDEDEDDETGKPPDGGWGWVIVGASFMVSLIADGATFSFGVIYVEFLKYFGESHGKTAWIGGLFMAVPLLSGPLASSLTDRYGCRAVTIAGSILAALGFILSSISKSLELLFFTFGILSGFGLSLCYVAGIVIVAYYFEQRRSLATGLAVCGSGLGTFVFAPLTRYLIDEYGWRGTTLIVAGFFLNMCVCGALMRPLEGTKKITKKRKRNLSSSAGSYRSRQWSGSQFCATPDKNDMEDSGNFDFNEADVVVLEDRLCNSMIHLPTFLCHGEKIPREVLAGVTNNPRLCSIVMDNYPALFDDSRGNHDNSAVVVSKPKRESMEKIKTFLGNCKGDNWNSAHLKGLRMKKTSLTYRGAMLNLPRYRLRASSCPDIYKNSITTIAKEKGALWDWTEELRQVLVDMLDLSYFSNPRFLMFVIANTILYCCYHVPYVYMADWAIAQGVDEEKASFLLSVIGILNTLGGVILGYLGDRPWANATLVYAGCMFLCGLSVVAVPLLPSYTSLAVAAGVFGFTIAADYSLCSAILVDLISLERFVNAYGLVLLFQGAANLVGPPLAGWIRDVTGSHNPSFYIAGSLIILSGTILVALPLGKRLKRTLSAAPSISGESIQDRMNVRVYYCLSCFRRKPTTQITNL